MNRDQLMAIPQVRDLVSQLPAQDQAAMLDLLSSVGAAATADAGVATRRTMARRDAGVPRQGYKLWNNYYSVVRFAASSVVTGGGTTTVTWNAGQEQRPFNYRIGDPLVNAGFPAGFGAATQADTNLVKAGETTAGEQVYVGGISIMPGLTTDVGAFSFLNDVMSVRISMDGDQRQYRLGRPYMIPASGGLYGVSTSVITNFQNGAWSNGIPDICNYYPFPEPLLWTSSGETDSTFNVVLRIERGTSSASATVAATSPATSTDFGAFADFMVRLHTMQEADRSLNQ